MLYDTVESQRVHYDNTEGHFRESDRAEAAYRLHQRFEKYTYLTLLCCDNR